jgi:hypothetical protein
MTAMGYARPLRALLFGGTTENLAWRDTGSSACVVELDHPRELRTNHSGQIPQERKRGLVQAPSFLELTPLNRIPSRGWVPATPGSQSCKQRWLEGEQAMCQHFTRNSQAGSLLKARGLGVSTRFSGCASRVLTYKFPQGNTGEHPFFGRYNLVTRIAGGPPMAESSF